MSLEGIHIPEEGVHNPEVALPDISEFGKLSSDVIAKYRGLSDQARAECLSQIMSLKSECNQSINQVDNEASGAIYSLLETGSIA